MSYNKKIAIVYKSKYGCTMKYAGWLAIKLDADLYEVSDVGRWDLLKYKTIKNKNLILYCVNLNLQNKKDIIDYNFENEEVKNKIKFFFLDGSINYDNLTRIDKIKLKKSLKKNRAFNVVKLEKNINVDRSDKHTIKPIINYVLEKTY